MRRITTIIILLLFLLYYNTGTAQTGTKTECYSAQGHGVTAHFTWGVDFGSSIDMSGNDMSSLDISAHLGYKGKAIRFLGLGAGIHTALGNDYAFMPVYLLLRTSFRQRPSLCFLDLRAGYSFNTLAKNESQACPYGSVGVGFNLYSSAKFKSHIILSYAIYQLKDYMIDNITYKFSNLNTVSIGIGIGF